MTRNTAAAIFLSFAMAAGPAYAEPEGPKVVPLFEGEIGTFDGFHVPEARMDEYNRAEVEVDDLKLRLASEKERCRKKLEVYVVKLKEATVHPPWYKTSTANLIIGFAAGILVAGASVKAAASLTQ